MHVVADYLIDCQQLIVAEFKGRVFRNCLQAFYQLRKVAVAVTVRIDMVDEGLSD